MHLTATETPAGTRCCRHLQGRDVSRRALPLYVDQAEQCSSSYAVWPHSPRPINWSFDSLPSAPAGTASSDWCGGPSKPCSCHRNAYAPAWHAWRSRLRRRCRASRQPAPPGASGQESPGAHDMPWSTLHMICPGAHDTKHALEHPTQNNLMAYSRLKLCVERHYSLTSVSGFGPLHETIST